VLLSIIELNVFGDVKLLVVGVWGFVRVRTALLGAEKVKFEFAKAELDVPVAVKT
jgi:hypothetical protein